MELSKKTAIVTGGADGLGLAITKVLLKEGMIVHVFSRDAKKQQEVKTELNNPNLFLHKVDVTDYALVANTVAEIGTVDILINNAGVWLEGQLVDNTPESISQVVDINVKGVMYVTRAVLPGMLTKNSGYILNVSSTSGLKGREGQSVYAASKYAVTGFTESLAYDLEKSNIKMLGFYPGGMATNLFAKAGFPKDNASWMDTDKVAEVVVFMLKHEDGMRLGQVVLSRI